MTPTPVPAGDKRDGYRAAVDRAVVAFGTAQDWPAQQVNRASRICYRTVWTESDWRNLANPSVPESLLVLPNDGNGKDLDSTGLYQQRESQGWGSVLGSMEPYTATQRFLRAMLRDVPTWYSLDESRVCQLVQRSQFDGRTIDPKTGEPYPFAANYIARGAQTDALAADLLYFIHLRPR